MALMLAEFGGLVLSYAAGALSMPSPCVLPLLVIVTTRLKGRVEITSRTEVSLCDPIE